ncbi:MAG: NAD-dependent epimerase/dehydratase family protein [Bacillota bacterium]
MGNNLVRQLVPHGFKVRCMVLPGENVSPLESLEVQVVKGDVRDLHFLERAFQGAEIVYHLASVISLLPQGRRLMEEVNVNGTRNVAEACLQTEMKRLLSTSSVHALVEPGPRQNQDESMPTDPPRISMAYGQSKARATLEVMAAVKKGLDAVVILPTGMVGPYGYRPSEMGQFILALARGKLPAQVCGGYDFVDVRDVAQAHILAAHKGSRGQCSSFQVNGCQSSTLWANRQALPASARPEWCSDQPPPKRLGRVLTAYSMASGCKPLITTDAVNTLLSNCSASSSKARRELGYSPRPMSQTLQDTVQWFRDQGWL